MTLDAVKYFTTIMNHPDIVALVGDRIHWDLAEPSTGYPFLVFDLADSGYASKDLAMPYTASVRVLAKTLTEAVTIGSAIREVVKENFPKIHDRGSSHGYTDAEAKEAVMEFKFEFKHK